MAAPLASRSLCTQPPDQPDAEQKDDILFSGKEEVIFEGGKNKIVGTLKKLSIANLGFALASAPLLQYITSASGSPGKGIAMSGLLIFFGGGTTAALTWATSTYVLSVKTIPGKDSLLIESPTFFGASMFTEVQWDQISRPGYHPFVTFEAAGKKFYLDELGEMRSEAFPKKLEDCLNR
ncbi:MAG: hypothetical protein SGPRY_000912 [Prymnesium sp.]